MENQTSVPPCSVLAHPASTELRNELSRCGNALQRRGSKAEIGESDAPSLELRAALRRRAEMLRASLQPAGAEMAAGFVLAIFAGFYNGSGGGSAAKLEVGVYARALAAFPVWALRLVVEKVGESRAASRPSWPVLRGYARDAVAASERELREIESVLAATIVARIAPSAKRPALGARLREAVRKIEPPKKVDRGPLVAPAMLVD